MFVVYIVTHLMLFYVRGFVLFLSVFPGMTMVKFAKTEEGGVAFVERRRAALER